MKVLEKLRFALMIALVSGLTIGVTSCGGEEDHQDGEETHGEHMDHDDAEHPGDEGEHMDHDAEHPGDEGEHPSDEENEHPAE
jgi:hypothetical protein